MRTLIHRFLKRAYKKKHLGIDMDIQDTKWEHYPHVSAHSAARSFVEPLTLKGKRPKTIDAYARAIEDLLAYFSGVNSERVLEADEADLDRDIDTIPNYV